MGKTSAHSSMRHMLHLLLFLVPIPAIFAAEADAEKNLQSSNDKKGRLFYVYTSKKTTTVFSASTCYVTATTVTACTRRKKSIIADLYDEDADISFDTVTSLREEDDDFAEKDPSLDASLEHLDSSIEDADKSFRDAKVLLYWLTTTSVSTKYSYTQTFTVASIKCTPTGWGVSECGK